MAEECKSCRFYLRITILDMSVRTGREEYVGYCRAHPPIHTETFGSGFGKTADCGWCGEYSQGIPIYAKSDNVLARSKIISEAEVEQLRQQLEPPASPDQSISA